MSEWDIAVIAAGSALAGSVITGWFARSAGVRQAKATQQAGERQADALLDTVRMTFEEQRVIRMLDLRRQTYLRLLETAETVIVTRRTGGGSQNDRPALHRALAAVLLEGPPDVARAARELVDHLQEGDNRSLDNLELARLRFIEACHDALNHQEPSSE